MGKTGLSLVSVLVALFLLLVGVITLVRTIPPIAALSERSRNLYATSLIADKVFAVIEQVYGSPSGPDLPACIEGTDPNFPRYAYRATFREEKPGLWQTEIAVTWTQEGKEEMRCFYQDFRKQEKTEEEDQGNRPQDKETAGKVK